MAAHLDVAQAFPEGQLRKCHRPKLLRATKFTHAKIAIILRNQTIKTGPWNKIHDLRKQRSAKVHGGAPDWKKSGKTADSSNGVQIDTK
jgi:hypothetical protein